MSTIRRRRYLVLDPEHMVLFAGGVSVLCALALHVLTNVLFGSTPFECDPLHVPRVAPTIHVALLVRPPAPTCLALNGHGFSCLSRYGLCLWRLVSVRAHIFLVHRDGTAGIEVEP